MFKDLASVSFQPWLVLSASFVHLLKWVLSCRAPSPGLFNATESLGGFAALFRDTARDRLAKGLALGTVEL